MKILNVYDLNDVNVIISRINNLTPTTKQLWGKMDVAKMLAHCNVTYEMVYDNIHKKPNAIFRFILKLFVKKIVTNEVEYKKNSSTAPEFIIKSNKDFDTEKQRLIAYLQRVQLDGASFFEGKESLSFGKMTSKEWNNLFYKHLNHHLSQFGV